MRINYTKKQAISATSLPKIKKIIARSALRDIVDEFPTTWKSPIEKLKYVRRIIENGWADSFTFVFLPTFPKTIWSQQH